MLEFILERANYWAIISLMMIGLYITYQSTNLIKKLVGLSVFQTSVFLFYITLGKIAGGSAPILFGEDAQPHGSEAAHGGEGIAGGAEHLAEGGHGVDPVIGLHEVYSNPLPPVLILTAIVVGVGTLAVGLALIRIREAYGTIESDEMRQMDIAVADAQDADDIVGTVV